MAVSKEKKKEVLDNISHLVKDSGSVVFANFHGLTVADVTFLRRGLKEKGVNYLVSKKTLAKRALTNAGIDGAVPQLDGELALVYGRDPLAPARELYEFQKKYKGSLSILGGIFERKFMSKIEMTEIALIPPLKVLYAQVATIINSPLRKLAVVLDQIAQKKTA
jgi:large subunit ribosomal protein L10